MRGGRTLEEAAAMIERRRLSGLTIQAFCEAENINVATYYYWQQRLRFKEQEEVPILVPISIEKSEQIRGRPEEHEHYQAIRQGTFCTQGDKVEVK